jgi:prefoldin subunit 5
VEGRLEEIQEQQEAIIDALTALDQRIAELEKHLQDQGGAKSFRDRWTPR